MNDGDATVDADGGSPASADADATRDAASVLDEAIDRPAASAGLVAAAVALAAAFLPWTDSPPLVP